MRIVYYPPGPQTPWTDGLIQYYHLFMIVTADSENETRRWVFRTHTNVLIGKLVGQTHPLRLMLH